MTNTRKILFLSLIPITTIAIYIFFLGLNIPFWDQWEVVSLLIKKQQGILLLADLFSQHNEHRPFFPRLIWLTLASLTRYNVNAELWVNLLIAIGTFVFFADRSIKMWKRLEISAPVFLIPLMSLLIFNLGQYESWLQGIQTVMFLEMACIIIGLFLLTEDPAWRNFFGAAALGVVATFSTANGLLYWLVGLIVVSITAPEKIKIPRIILWVIFSGICIGFFLTGWTSVGHLNFTYVFSHILEWLLWILNFLGAPIMTHWSIAWIFGIISAGSYLLIIRHVIRKNQWRPLIPYFAIVLFITLTTLSISLGRMELGMIQSTVSRYLTMSAWYWASLLALLPILNLKSLHRHVFYSIIAASLFLLMILSVHRGYTNIYQRILPAYQAISAGETISDEILSRIYPDPKVARPRLEFLCENHLSVCEQIK